MFSLRLLANPLLICQLDIGFLTCLRVFLVDQILTHFVISLRFHRHLTVFDSKIINLRIKIEIRILH